MSRRETIVAAAVAALNTGTPVGVPAAERLRRRQYDAAVVQAMAVYPLREEVLRATNRHGPSVTRQLTLLVECRVKSDTPDAALDPLLEWATAALVGSTLGGVALDVQEQRTEFDFSQREDGFGLAAVEFQVSYLTRVNDQTIAG